MFLITVSPWRSKVRIVGSAQSRLSHVKRGDFIASECLVSFKSGTDAQTGVKCSPVQHLR